jgi:uncharacterized damage-inducible protein DinB
MANSKLVGLVFDSWDDFDRVLNELDIQEAIENPNGGSSFTWTLAHVTEQVDKWINVIAQNMLPHPTVEKKEFRFRGTGISQEWQLINQASQEVRAKAKSYLENLSDTDLESIVLNDNDPNTRPERKQIKLYSMILRIVAHYYFHIGEIAAKRDSIGHSVGDYPGSLKRTL